MTSLLINQSYIEDSDTRRIVVSALLKVIDLTFEFRRSEFTSTHLKELRKSIIPDALTALHNLYLCRQRLKGTSHLFAGIKLHVLMHYDYLISRFGVPPVWDTDTFQSAHKDMVKELYRRS